MAGLGERLADYAAALRFDALSKDVVHEAKKRVIDTFACTLGAYESRPAKDLRSIAPVVKNKPMARILGSPAPTTPDFAAFVNGFMARYLDYNDTYLSKEPAHPSDNIMAALACAESSGASGADLITAIVAAYEVQCRLCDAASLRSKGWDHVTYGAFSVTVAASMLLGLSRDETLNAIGIAGVTSPALRQTRAGELSTWKGCAFANSARNAVFSSILAKNGITGPNAVFEGEFGFFKLVSGEFDMHPFGVAGGDRFKILDSYIKYYPAEYHAQSAIGAAVELSAEIEAVSEIESIRVSTFGAGYEIIGSGRERWRPRTRETADHSLPYCVAAALMDGNITTDSFSEDRLDDEKLLSLIDKIEVVKDPDLDRMYPEAMPDRVEVRLKNGTALSREIIYPKGHPKNPLTDLEVEEKFRRLGGWYFEGNGIDRVLNFLWSLEKIKDAGEVLNMFIPGVRI